jgi:hypothetical protein
VIVLALSWGGGGGHPPAQQAASAVRDSAATEMAPAQAKTAADSSTQTRIESATPAKPAAKKCAPASRKAGDRPPAACPGARGGHARAV